MNYTDEQMKCIIETAQMNPEMDWTDVLQFCEEIVFDELGINE